MRLENKAAGCSEELSPETTIRLTQKNYLAVKKKSSRYYVTVSK